MNPSWMWRDLAAAPWIAAMVNHLWQSTLAALAAALLTLALRGNRAGVRYWLWFLASISFVFPFSVLIAAGKVFRPAVPIAAPGNSFMPALQQIAEPFSPAPVFVLSNTGPSLHLADLLPALLAALWACGALLAAMRYARSWLAIRSAVRTAAPHPRISAGVPVLETQALIEPGIFGVFKPVLLFPAGIEDRLTGAQLEAIVAHEMSHVHRRDNFTFAIHQVVQALFWFHPLVWFIGARLIDERERACDEATLETGNDSQVYAEGILNVCRFCIESPAACVAGVSGSDLKKRVTRILRGCVVHHLGPGRKLILAAAGVAVLLLPAALGLLHTDRLLAQTQDAPSDIPKYAVATIKPSKSVDRIMLMFKPDGVSMTGVPLQMMLRSAFDVEDDRIVGAPEWVKSEHFDVEAKVDPADAPKLEKLKRNERFMMLQPLLEERFGLKFHHETRELPVYTLVVARGGPKLKQSAPDDPTEKGPKKGRMTMMNAMGSIDANGSSMENLSHILSSQLGRTVVDKTGLTGNYDYTLKWIPDNVPAPPPGATAGGDSAADTSGPSLFTAVQEQLGLKLESEKAPVDVIVIDRVEQPSAN